MARHDLLLFLRGVSALEVERRERRDGEQLDGAEEQHVRHAGGGPGGLGQRPPPQRERVDGRDGGAEREGRHDVGRGLRAAPPQEAPRARHGGGAAPPGLGGGDHHRHGADDGEVGEGEAREEDEQRVEEEEEEGVVEEDHREERRGQGRAQAGELERVAEGEGEDGSPPPRVPLRPRRRETVVGEGADGGEDGGDLDGRPGEQGGEEARAGGEEEALDVGLEGAREVAVRRGGRVGAADGVRVGQHGGGQRLHGERVAEEERGREGGGQGQQRQEEAPIPGREDEAMAQEGEEARRLSALPRRVVCHGCDRAEPLRVEERKTGKGRALVVDVERGGEFYL
jgi:hypothetical protein